MVNAVICEFNPFHNGHKYMIAEAQKRTDAQYTVCFMSGDFVQRGEPAVCTKHERAAAAVQNGADLVFQIPTSHSLSGASIFADSGVYMSSALGVPTALCFGTECEDMTGLYRLALTDRHKLAREFTKFIDTGMSYGEAVMSAYTACGADGAELLRSPNNLLAFEYIKSVISRESDLKLINIKREGASHDGAPSGVFASATYLRKNPSDAMKYIPVPFRSRIDLAKFDTVTLFSVMSKTPEELSRFADMSEGLENRFAKAAGSARTAAEMYDLVKSKRYTHSKIRRAAMSVLVGNTPALAKQSAPYMKVLAFNDKGRELLKTLSKTCTLPIITKPADTSAVPGGADHFALECRAADIYDFCSFTRNGTDREYRQSPIYITERQSL